jgi:hypothetical protein
MVGAGGWDGKAFCKYIYVHYLPIIADGWPDFGRKRFSLNLEVIAGSRDRKIPGKIELVRPSPNSLPTNLR